MVRRTPAVTVMMCVYNSKPFLAEALDGILSQTFADFELIVVDDGSTDGSSEIVEAYAARDPRIIAIGGEHRGLIESRNLALSEARGKYLAIADSDDISLPQRLETQTRFMEQHPEYVSVGCSRLLIDPDGLPICEARAETDPQALRALLAKGTNGEGCVLMMRRDTMIAAGGYCTDCIDSIEDLDLLLRMAETGEVGNVPEVLIKYRKHFQSICYSNPHLIERLNIVLARRGLPPVPVKSSPFASLPSEQQNSCRMMLNRARWSMWAFKAGNYRTAARNAMNIVKVPNFTRSLYNVARVSAAMMRQK